jgi:hypothetical protein
LEGFSCNLAFLNEGLGPGDKEIAMFYKRIIKFISQLQKFLSSRFTVNPELDPGLDPQFEKNAGSGCALNECGSETIFPTFKNVT